MQNSKLFALIIIPTYNERENVQKIVPILDSVFESISTWKMGVLIVDDSSPDGTAEEVRRLQKNYKWLELLVNKQKKGLGAAYLKGMEEAFDKHNADVVFEFDADLSHDPTRIPEFLKKLDSGADMVLGSRYMPGGSIPQNWGLHRKFLSVVGNWVIRIIMTDLHIKDWTTGYRAIRRKVYEAVHPHLHGERFTGYTFQIGFLSTAVRQGFKIVEVPFHFVDREIGQSKLGAEYVRNTLSYILRLRAKDILNNRIFKFVMVGGLGALVQFMSLAILRNFFPYQLAFFLAIEVSVLSNFTWSNLWTFADRKLPAHQWPAKFVQFNLASAGSIVIQQIVAIIGQTTLGTEHILFTVPFIQLVIDTGMSFAVIGIFLGMFWNFFAYNAFIWKKHS